MHGATHAASAAEPPISHPLFAIYHPSRFHCTVRRLQVLRGLLVHADPALRALLQAPPLPACKHLFFVATALEGLDLLCPTACMLDIDVTWSPASFSDRPGHPVDWRPTLRTLDPLAAARVLAAMLSRASRIAPLLMDPAAARTPFGILTAAITNWAANFGTPAAQSLGDAALVAVRRALTEVDASLLPRYDATAVSTASAPLQVPAPGYQPGLAVAWSCPG
jgi:hypothetical protein